MSVEEPAEPASGLRVTRPTVFWQVMHALCFAYFVPAYRFRAWGAQHVPMTGPTLLVSNHQSYFDPIIVGLPLARRRFYALARKTLWDQKAVGWLITQLGALPVDQENPGDLKAMRACIDVLKRDQMLLIYPEGARSLSGQVEAFQPGTMLLIKRARPTVVPVGIAGADGVWERGRKLPAATGRLGVSFGEPIPASTLLAMSAQDAVGMLRERVVGLVDQTRSRLE